MATKYSKEQLERHLSYEILMLNGTYKFIMSLEGILETAGVEKSQREIALNAMKEGFCLYARALLEFFVARRTNSASEFASAYQSNPEPPGVKQKLNNQIAHLMDGRTDNEADMIGGEGRDVLLRWIDVEVRRWKAGRDAGFASITIPDVDITLIPADYMLIGGQPGPSSYPIIIKSDPSNRHGF